MAERTNEEWGADLRNDGSPEQIQAFEDLGRYLFVVAHNYLLKRRPGTPGLSDLADSEIAEEAQHFVQDALLIVWQKLCSYRDGRFLSWAKTIAINEVRQELRKKRWHAIVRPPEEIESGSEEDRPGGDDWLSRLARRIDAQLCAEQSVQFNEVMDLILRTLREKLSERQRRAFLGCVLKNKPYAVVAREIGAKINRVYGIVYECRKILKRQLEEAGFTLQDVYAIFEKGD